MSIFNILAMVGGCVLGYMFGWWPGLLYACIWGALCGLVEVCIRD